MKKISILTGAGISAESGIRTFRDSDGLWENHRVEDVASPEGFERDPTLVWEFYKQRYHQSEETSPNKGHLALVKLEDVFEDNFCLITQNVDGLHKRAGSSRLYEMHGSLYQVFCTSCRSQYHITEIELAPAIPLCVKCGSMLRPDIVWFGEVPYFLKQIDEILRKSDIFLILGTSGVVYPAAAFVMTAKYFGATTIGVNLDTPENLGFLDEFHQGKCGEILPGLVDELISQYAS